MGSPDYLGFIPAAGLGTRLLPLTLDYAKPAIPIDHYDGQTDYLIGHSLKAVAEVAHSSIVTTHYLGWTVIRALIESPVLNDFTVRVQREQDFYHVGGSMLKQRRLIEASRAKAVVMVPGDAHITPGTIEAAVDRFEVNKPDITFIGTRDLTGHDIFSVNESGRLRRDAFPSGDGEQLGNLGVYVFQKNWLLHRFDTLTFRPNGWYDPLTDLILGEDSGDPDIDFLVTDDHGVGITDLGTVGALHSHIMNYAQGLDDQGNLVFPGVKIDSDASLTQSILYPGANVGPGVELAEALVGPQTEVKSASAPVQRVGNIVLYSAHAQVENYQAAEIA